ncbi:MAG: PepSY-associated TM helix domain-containing protein [Pseudomonadota bacterium]
MKEGFRQSMAWLHTWSGLLGGWVLFLVFCAGTACYFKDEISFWMRPELHQASLAVPAPPESAAVAMAAMQERAPTSKRWFITLPSAREPGVRATWERPPAPKAAKGEPGGEKPVARRNRFENATLDPNTGKPLLAARETRGGEFLYRLHFDLHYMPAIWARWIVGFCAMFMLVAIVSGIITHKRIFKDFFTFRPKKGQRSWLDAHNVTAVVALPYHLMITYTGLVTLMFMYMPWGQQAVYKADQDAFNAEVFASSSPRDAKAAGVAAPLAPIGPMVEQAMAHWNGAPVGRITVNHPNDANATVSLLRQGGHDMSSLQPSMLFNGVTGARVSTAGDSAGPAVQTRGVLYGLHTAHFGNPLLRGLFFLSGLAGCVMVATGLVMWAVKERQKYAKVLAHGGRTGWGLRLVEGLNLGAIAGVPLAMAVYFWANRLLPLGIAERSQAEITAFFAALGLAMVLGLARPTRRMWQLVLALGGALFAAVPLLNAATTATHLGVSLTTGLWVVAGFDLVCLLLGAALLASAAWLGRKQAAKAPARKATAATTDNRSMPEGAVS